jgi:hypothetical protein
MRGQAHDVRSEGQSRLGGRERRFPVTQMYGPAVRCKRLWSTLADAGLHQCIRSLIGACCAPDHHGYQRACDLISGQASMDHLGHQCSHAPGRPILHRRLILSQSSAGKGTDYVIDNLPGFAPFLCSCLAAVPSSRPEGAEVRRAQGPSRLAVALALSLAPALPGHALTGPSTAQGLSASVRCFIGLDALEGAPLVKNRPGDAGELVGERNRQHVVV